MQVIDFKGNPVIKFDLVRKYKDIREDIQKYCSMGYIKDTPLPPLTAPIRVPQFPIRGYLILLIVQSAAGYCKNNFLVDLAYPHDHERERKFNLRLP